MDFDLRQLEVFSAVVEHASFSRAADAVNLAQPSVSERVAILEREVGTRLLDRLGRKVVPTPVGQLLYDRAQALLADHRGIIEELRAALDVRGGQIELAATGVPGEYLLPEILSRFRELAPEVRVSVAIADTREVLRRVESHEVELAVVGTQIERPHLRYDALLEDRLVLIAGREHPWPGRSEIDAAELVDVPFVARSEGSGTRREIEQQLTPKLPAGAKLLPSLELGTTAAVKAAVRAGLGVAVVPERTLNGEVSSGEIARLDIRDTALTRSLYLVVDERRSFSPACRRFIELLRAAH